MSAKMHLARFGYVGLANIGHGITNVAIVIDLESGGPTHGTRRALVLRAVAAISRVAERMRHARLVTPVRGVGPFARWTSRATANRTFAGGRCRRFPRPVYRRRHLTPRSMAASSRRRTQWGRSRAADSAQPTWRNTIARVATRFGGNGCSRNWSVRDRTPRVFDRFAGRIARRQRLADLMIGWPVILFPCPAFSARATCGSW